MDAIPLLLALFVVPGSPALAPVDVYTDGEVFAIDREMGTGASASDGQVATIHYVLSQTAGKELSDSAVRGLPFSVLLQPSADDGTDSRLTLVDALRGMRIGGTREVILPSERLVGIDSSIVPKDTSLTLTVRLIGLASLKAK